MSFRLQNGYQNEPPNGTRNWTPQKGAPVRKKNPVFQKGVRNDTPKGGALWGSCLFYVGLLFFARFWGLPTLLWTIICLHFRALGLDFLVFSRLRFQDFGANETHPIHTHINQPYSFSIKVALCGLVGMREAWGILYIGFKFPCKNEHIMKKVCLLSLWGSHLLSRHLWSYLWSYPLWDLGPFLEHRIQGPFDSCVYFWVVVYLFWLYTTRLIKNMFFYMFCIVLRFFVFFL